MLLNFTPSQFHIWPKKQFDLSIINGERGVDPNQSYRNNLIFPLFKIIYVALITMIKSDCRKEKTYRNEVDTRMCLKYKALIGRTSTIY